MQVSKYANPRHRFMLLYAVFIGLTVLLFSWVFPEHWWAAALTGALAILLAWIVALVVERRLRRRFHQLREAADAFSRGELTRHIEYLPDSDFAKLAGSLQRIMDQFREKAEEEDRLRRQLTRSEKLALIGELAAIVAHEINNPLDGLQNCARILRRNRENAEQARQLLDLMDSGLYRIEMIVRRLLSMSRDEPVRLLPTRIDEIVNDAILFVQPRLERGRIEMVRSFPDTLLPALADRMQLAQALINLAINAADSMPDGGRLEIRARPGEHGQTVRLEVRDTGKGIAEIHMPHIFEPFFTTKQKGLGSGLGLPVTKRIVEAHNGTIEVHSTVGEGTCFTITLPAAVERTEPASTLEVYNQPGDSRETDKRAPACQRRP